MLDQRDMRPSNRCLVPPLPEHDEAALLLSRATDAIIAGDVELASDLARRADMAVLHDHATLVMGGRHPLMPPHGRIVPKSTETVPRQLERMPTRRIQSAVYARDGWRCRFCDCRVVSPDARKIMRGMLPGVVGWSDTEGYHGAFFALSASLDHVVPHSVGGGNDEENLVTSCWSCQFGRGHFLLEEFDLSDPRDRPPIKDEWDGLTRLLTMRTPAAERIRTPIPYPQASRSTASGVEGWSASIDAIQPGTSRRVIALVESCADLGVTWSLKEVLLIRMTIAGEMLCLVGIERDGTCQIPWYIAGAKDRFRVFAETLAMNLPDGIAYETPKTWTVSRARKQRLNVLELLEGASALRGALEALRSAYPLAEAFS